MKSNIFKKAHELTKKIIKAGDNYKATFRLCLTFVYSQVKKGICKMVELKGTDKQVEFAENLRSDMLEYANKEIKHFEEKRELKINQGKKHTKTDERIIALNSFVNLIEKTEQAIKVIKVYEFITNTRYKAIYNIDQLNEIIYE